MDNLIHEWANDGFYEGESIYFPFDDIDVYELSNFIDRLELEGSSWSHEELHVQSVKSYDEDGNSDYYGILSVSSQNKTPQDFLELATYFDELYAKDEYEDIFI